MGFNSESVVLLKQLSAEEPLGQCLTLGRQLLCAHLFKSKINRSLLNNDYSSEVYGDKLLVHEFGATSVQALDFDDSEGASIIQDLNYQLSDKYTHLQFDTILDFGTLEHLFNIPQALSTILSLCKPNGRIIHVLPSNNWCGHGYYQFSPEFFSMIYSKENHFIDTRIYITRWNQINSFFELILPVSSSPDLTGFRTGKLQCLVCTRKTSQSSIKPSPQYIYSRSISPIATKEISSPHNRAKQLFKQKLKLIINKYLIVKMLCWRIFDLINYLSLPSSRRAFKKVNLLK